MKNRRKHRIIGLVAFLLCVQQGTAQTVFGTWRTIDDLSGKEKGIVEVYEENGMLQAKIIEILEEGKENALCVKCKGALKNKPIKGLQIIRDFKRNKGGEYKGSYLLEPESGSFYRGKIWLNPNDQNQLRVRGYIAFLYRTQTWHRITEK